MENFRITSTSRTSTDCSDIVLRETNTTMEFDVSTFRKTVEEFKAFLGEKCFSALMGRFAPADTRGLRAYQQHAAAAHPFALWWTQLEKDVSKTEAAGHFVIGDSSLFLLDMYINLRAMSSDPYFPTVLEKLSAANQFYSTDFEAFIYAAYKRRGYPIQLVPTEQGRRTADFSIVVGSDRLLIECKSMQDPSEEEANIWFSICARVSKILQNARCQWRVTFNPARYIRGIDEESIVRACRERIEDGDMEAAELVSGIRWTAQLLDGVWPVQRRTDFGWVEADIRTDLQGGQTASNITHLEVDRFFDPDETDRLQQVMDDAYHQLDRDCAGMVYVQIPFRASKQFLAVADKVFNRTFGRLQNNYPRIASVGLVGRSVDTKMKPGGNALMDYFAVVPNPKPRVPLPKCFSVLSAQGGENPGIGSEGTFFMEFAINEPLPEQIGRSLYNFCSYDGQVQLRLWQSFDNHFRADIVHPEFGRRTFRADLNDLTVGPFHKLAIAFGNKDPRLAVNGRIIEPIH